MAKQMLWNKKINITALMIILTFLIIFIAFTIPKFIDFSSNEQISATNTIAGALSAANASNYAARRVNHSLGVAINNCTNVGNALQNSLPNGYTIKSTAVTTDTTVTCTLTGPNSTTATFNATGIN